MSSLVSLTKNDMPDSSYSKSSVLRYLAEFTAKTM